MKQILVIPVILLLAPAAHAQLFGMSSGAQPAIFQIDKSTGKASSFVSVNRATSLGDLAFVGQSAYATDVFVNGDAAFGRIDLATGTFTALGDQDGSTDWWGLAADEANSRLYTVDHQTIAENGTTFDALKRLDLAGQSTVIGATGAEIRGLAFDPTLRTLYGTSNNTLYTLNLTTGAATAVGNYGSTFESFAVDLAFDPLANQLFLNGLAPDGRNRLYRVNTSTAALTEVGANEFDDDPIDALGYRSPVPEPATGIMLLLPMALIARRRKR